jgi:hypothetical protein
VLTEARAEFAELQLLAARLATDRVIVIAGLLANEEHSFDLALALSTFTHGNRPSFGLPNLRNEMNR